MENYTWTKPECTMWLTYHKAGTAASECILKKINRFGIFHLAPTRRWEWHRNTFAFRSHANYHEHVAFGPEQFNLLLSNKPPSANTIYFCMHGLEYSYSDSVCHLAKENRCKIVQVVRNPFALLVSAYLYHKQAVPLESWL